MADSELLDFSRRDRPQPAPAQPRRGVWRPRPLTVVLLVALVGLPLLAVWVHLGRVHVADLAAFEALRADFALVDANAKPFLHGESPPCETSDEVGVVTRTYSPTSGPTIVELRNALRLVGFWPRATTPGAIYTMDHFVDGHRLVVEVLGHAQGPDARGFSLRATSPATALACFLR